MVLRTWFRITTYHHRFIRDYGMESPKHMVANKYYVKLSVNGKSFETTIGAETIKEAARVILERYAEESIDNGTILGGPLVVSRHKIIKKNKYHELILDVRSCLDELGYELNDGPNFRVVSHDIES
jgi:hypothetical protein